MSRTRQGPGARGHALARGQRPLIVLFTPQNGLPPCRTRNVAVWNGAGGGTIRTSMPFHSRVPFIRRLAQISESCSSMNLIFRCFRCTFGNCNMLVKVPSRGRTDTFCASPYRQSYVRRGLYAYQIEWWVSGCFKRASCQQLARVLDPELPMHPSRWLKHFRPEQFLVINHQQVRQGVKSRS
jgi:hypothetical protein